MRKLIIGFCLFLLSAQLFSQKESDSLKITHLIIKTSPFAPFNPLISSAMIGFEYRHKQNYAIDASYYFKIPSVLPYVKGKTNETLLKYNIEFRKYFQDELYLGIEYGHIDYSHGFPDDYYILEKEAANGTREIALFN